MGKKKMVLIEDIEILSDMIDDLIDNPKDSDLITKLLTIKLHIKNNILEEDKLFINDLKRSIYLQMKGAKTEKEREGFYKIYQTLKQAEH